MDGWMDGWMDRWMNGWMDVWMDGWMDDWIDDWMYVCMYGWMYGWMDGRLYLIRLDRVNRFQHLHTHFFDVVPDAIMATTLDPDPTAAATSCYPGHRSGKLVGLVSFALSVLF